MALAMATMLGSLARVAITPRCSSDASTSGSSGSGSVSVSSTPGHGRLMVQVRENSALAAATEALSWSTDAAAVVSCPALQHANLMWFKGAYNAQVFCGEDEPADSVVRRFRKAVMQAGVIPECRRRRFFETPQDIVKRKQAARRRKPRRGPFQPREGEDAAKRSAKQNDDDNDFWGYAEEGADVNY